MGQLREKMEADLKIGGYASSTRRIYLQHARKFAAHLMRSPADMGADQVREFMLYLVENRGISPETLRQVRSALRFLYTVTLNRPMEIQWLPVPRKKKHLPVVLSGTEVAALWRPSFRLIFTAMYASGLRITEACRLQCEDIDSKRMLIRVRGKGNKERCTLLSPRLLRQLRDYWRCARPGTVWLFPGRTQEGHVARETAGSAFRAAVKTSGITRVVTPHALRHSFATHLIDTGTSITVVQALLGHESLRATEVYTHTSVEQIARTKSPLDLLGTPAAIILG